MGCDRLLDAAAAVGLLADTLYCRSGNGLACDVAREQPVLWPGNLPIGAKPLEQSEIAAIFEGRSAALGSWQRFMKAWRVSAQGAMCAALACAYGITLRWRGYPGNQQWETSPAPIKSRLLFSGPWKDD